MNDTLAAMRVYDRIAAKWEATEAAKTAGWVSPAETSANALLRAGAALRKNLALARLFIRDTRPHLHATDGYCEVERRSLESVEERGRDVFHEIDKALTDSSFRRLECLCRGSGLYIERATYSSLFRAVLCPECGGTGIPPIPVDIARLLDELPDPSVFDVAWIDTGQWWYVEGLNLDAEGRAETIRCLRMTPEHEQAHWCCETVGRVWIRPATDNEEEVLTGRRMNCGLQPGDSEENLPGYDDD